jgi:hypothetical protein
LELTMNPFAWIERALAFAAGAALVLVLSSVYWNGLPLLNDDPSINLPLVGEVSLSDVPLFGNMAVGHLEVEKRKSAEAARAGLVSKLELDAANARMIMLQKQLAQAQAIKELAEKEADRLDAEAKESADALASERAAAELRADSDAAVWTDADVRRVFDYRATRGKP